MDIRKFYADPGEKPLDNLVSDGGFCSIFRSIACVGDSLSSGEFEIQNEQGERSWHDFYDYSWGQFLARMTGAKVYNFSRGGMTAKEYMATFADERGFWDPALASQAYILALGVNELFTHSWTLEEFEPYFRQIIERYQQMAPDAKFFLVTIPRDRDDQLESSAQKEHAELMYRLAEEYPNCYVIDLFRYAPAYDEEFRKNFFLMGHMNACGYVLSAKMIASYIDYIIRNHPDDFMTAGLIGSGLRHTP